MLKKSNAASSTNVLIQKHNTELDKVADKNSFDDETEFLLEEYNNELLFEDDFKETTDKTVQYEGVKVRYFFFYYLFLNKHKILINLDK